MSPTGTRRSPGGLDQRAAALVNLRRIASVDAVRLLIKDVLDEQESRFEADQCLGESK